MSTLEAVIEIGSTGIRLLIGEISENGQWKAVDRSELPIALGWDVFTSGYVSRETLLHCLKILYRFREQIKGWAVLDTHISVIATSAMREAKNRDTVIDRILVKTGFKIKIIDGIEENRLMYIAVLHSLETEFPKLKTKNSVILEIGGGSTEIMLLERGKMAAVHSLRLGTVIIEQHLKAMMGSQRETTRFLEEFIRNTGVTMKTELNLEQVDQFISIGTEMQLAARQKGTQLSDRCWSLTRDSFNSFVHEIQEYSAEECMAQFKITYNEAKSLSIGLLSYKLFIDLTIADTILVSDTTIRDGLIISKLSTPNTDLQQEFLSQVTASAYNLGKKYHFDEDHAEFVTQTSLRIYDGMSSELGLNQHERLLLEVAAILHDIGMFIRAAEHQIHSQYIIAHSDIFGISKDDMAIISHVALYHRGKGPQPQDLGFYSLPRTDRMIVQKLAAILRVADALDRSHTQRIRDFDMEFKTDSFIIKIPAVYDKMLEKMAVSEKSDLFEGIFGYKIIIM